LFLPFHRQEHATFPDSDYSVWYSSPKLNSLP
jgi:hypothetical protein